MMKFMVTLFALFVLSVLPDPIAQASLTWGSQDATVQDIVSSVCPPFTKYKEAAPGTCDAIAFAFTARYAPPTMTPDAPDLTALPKLFRYKLGLIQAVCSQALFTKTHYECLHQGMASVGMGAPCTVFGDRFSDCTMKVIEREKARLTYIVDTLSGK